MGKVERARLRAVSKRTKEKEKDKDDEMFDEIENSTRKKLTSSKTEGEREHEDKE